MSFERNMLLARSNIRKAKGQTAAIIVLVLLSSMMMNLWLMLSMDYRQNFDRSHERLNDGHISIAAYPATDEFDGFMSDTLESRSDVTEYAAGEAYCTPLSMKYNGGEVSVLAILMNKDDALSRSVGKSEITSEGAATSGIYLPMLYGTGSDYFADDTISLDFSGEEHEYTLCGFINNTMSGSPNCGSMMILMLTEDKYKELSEDTSVFKATYISARVNDTDRAADICSEVKDEIAEEYPGITVSSNDYQMVTTSRYISQSICAGVLSAMAFLILLIGVVVITSNIANYIRENMQNLGALKAIGYTSGQIISSMISQFTGISAAAAVIGAALSYLIFPGINEMMIAQTGIPYTVKFQLPPLLLTMLFILTVVAAAVYLSAKKIKSIEPITAMRQGISTHSFRKNHVPLETTSMPLSAALAMKTTLSSLKQNVTVCITMLVVSLILVFSATAFRNTIMDSQPMLDMIAGEYTDAAVNVNTAREDELVSKLEADDRVEKFYLYSGNNLEIQHVNGSSLYVAVTNDCEKLNNKSMLTEGRYPKYDNEIAIAAKYAKDSSIKTGDEISVKLGTAEGKYIVTGFIQNANSLGRDCLMTREAYEKLDTLPNVTYYVDLTPGTDIDSFNSELSDFFGSDLYAALNVGSILEAASGVYVALMAVLVTAIVIISCIVIIFVMYLLVRTMLGSKKRDYGILKALGFTTGQLILQTAISFMPAVIISTAVGIAVSIPIIDPLFSVFLSGVGIVKCTFTVPVGLCILFGVILVIFAFAAACLLSMRVKKIAPRELLIGE